MIRAAAFFKCTVTLNWHSRLTPINQCKSGEVFSVWPSKQWINRMHGQGLFSTALLKCSFNVVVVRNGALRQVRVTSSPRLMITSTTSVLLPLYSYGCICQLCVMFFSDALLVCYHVDLTQLKMSCLFWAFGLKVFFKIIFKLDRLINQFTGLNSSVITFDIQSETWGLRIF